MTKRIAAIALLGISLIHSSCGNKGGFKTKDGLEYNMIVDKPGKNASVGDIMKLNIRVKIGDSILADSRKETGKPIQMPLQKPQYRGDWLTGLAMMSPGDSAVFMVSVDSIKKALPGQQLPPFMKSGKKLVYEVSMVSVQTQDDYKKEMEQNSAAQKGVDDKLLQDFFAKNNLKPMKTATGLYYIISKEGTGDNPKPGESVSVNYTGRTMDGKPFDSNTDTSFHHVEPFTFALGQHQVISGWDEGVSLMKKGAKGTLFIPSPLAYGPEGRAPVIPANAILMFDIEVTNIKNADTK